MTRLWAVAVVTVAVVVACERVPLTSPSGSTISISIDKESIPPGGTATVTAVVTETSGTPVHNGTMVTFQPSIGRTDPIDAPTVNGKATTTFIAGSISGAGVVHAFSGGVRTGSGNSSSGGATVKIGTAAVERISVRTEPNNVPITGGTVVVVATAVDGSGNPITNTPLTFSADFGTLSANSAATDANGEVRVSLTTNRTTAITVTAGGKSQSFTLTALNPPTVTVACGTGTTANTGNVGVPLNCTITTATSGNSSSSAPIQNLTINWGDGSGEIPLGALTGAQIIAHTYTSAGSFSVVAAATDFNSQRNTHVIALTITRAIPTISITGPTTGTGTVGTAVTFTVTPPATPTVPVSTVVVDFGDGTSRSLGSITAVQAVTKVFSSPGAYTVSATVTDIAGTRNTSSTAVVITGATAPTVVFTQTGTLSGSAIGTFVVTPTAPAGATIRSVVVRRGISNDGETVHQSTNGGTFAVNGLAIDHVLTATITDSLGGTTTAQVVVK